MLKEPNFALPLL